MSGGVFVLNDNALVEMHAASFAKENDFQRLLAEFPSLLSGDQIDPSSPRQWLLVRREQSLPSDESGAARWALDHLFIDQDAVPTLIEVKRQENTEIRRKVVGQMLDYATNAVVYLPVDRLRDDFETRCEAAGKDPDQEIKECLGLDDAEGFWQRVKTNLQAGRIRMLFVADLIPPELQRVDEFLNEQMDPAEVLALELRQYEGEGLKTLVPRIYGQTQEAQQKKAVASERRQWDEHSFFEKLEQQT